MPLFIPIALIAINTAGIVGGGVSGVQGALMIRRGRKLVSKATTTHEARAEETRRHCEEVQRRLDAYGAQRADARERVLVRAVDYLRANGRRAALADLEPLAEMPLRIDSLPPAAAEPEMATTVVRTTMSVATVVRGAPAALTAAAGAVGRASTGTAIRDLSGAASQKATLAWLGGGAKAVGGGGMALGSVMGPLSAVGTAVTVAGVGTKIVGQQQLTAATARAAHVDICTESLRMSEAAADAIRSRANEMSSILNRLNAEAENVLDELESMALDTPGVETLFHRMISLSTAVGEVIRIPIADDGFGVNPDTDRYVNEQPEEA